MSCSDLLQVWFIQSSSNDPGEFFKGRVIFKTATIETLNKTNITFQKCSIISAFYEYQILSENQYNPYRYIKIAFYESFIYPDSLIFFDFSHFIKFSKSYRCRSTKSFSFAEKRTLAVRSISISLDSDSWVFVIWKIIFISIFLRQYEKEKLKVFQASLTRFHVLNITYATHENSFDDVLLDSKIQTFWIKYE